MIPIKYPFQLFITCHLNVKCYKIIKNLQKNCSVKKAEESMFSLFFFFLPYKWDPSNEINFFLVFKKKKKKQTYSYAEIKLQCYAKNK